MNEAILRPSRPGDEAALKKVWAESFHDSMEFLDLFFRKHYRPGMSTLMECDGEPVSCIFTLSGTEYVEPGKEPLPCPYVYSLGTLEAYRGRGYGARVIQESVRRGFDEERAQWVALLPAEPSLYVWYSHILGSRTAFWTTEASLYADELPRVLPGHIAYKTDAASYGRLRELLLDKKPHVRYSRELLDWQEQSCRFFGGGMYLLNLDGQVGCAVVEAQDGFTDIKELLLPEGDIEAAAALIMSVYPAERLRLRTPVFWKKPGIGEDREYVVAIPKNEGEMPSPEAWWGLVFD